jgi:hypothetical protein
MIGEGPLANVAVADIAVAAGTASTSSIQITPAATVAIAAKGRFQAREIVSVVSLLPYVNATLVKHVGGTQVGLI